MYRYFLFHVSRYDPDVKNVTHWTEGRTTGTRWVKRVALHLLYAWYNQHKLMITVTASWQFFIVKSLKNKYSDLAHLLSTPLSNPSVEGKMLGVYVYDCVVWSHYDICFPLYALYSLHIIILQEEVGSWMNAELWLNQLTEAVSTHHTWMHAT